MDGRFPYGLLLLSYCTIGGDAFLQSHFYTGKDSYHPYRGRPVFAAGPFCVLFKSLKKSARGYARAPTGLITPVYFFFFFR